MRKSFAEVVLLQSQDEQVTVGELIRQLKKLPKDELVFCSANSEYKNLPVSGAFIDRKGRVTICAD